MSGTPQQAASVNSASALASAQPNSPVGQACIPCMSNFRVEANYDDLWRTPITQAQVRVEYIDGEVIDAGGETLGTSSFGQEDGTVADAIRPDLGSFEGTAPHFGRVIARIEPQAGPDPADLEAAIISDLEEFAGEMETAMGPWTIEWEESGWLGFLGSLWTGLQNGVSSWWEGEGDFWNAVGDWLYNLPEMIGDAWDSVSESAKALWDNRDQIFELLKNLGEGAIDAFESGIATLSAALKNIPGLEEIAGLLEDLVDRSAEWAAAMIELATRTSVLRVLGATVLGVFMMIPPNFYSEMVATGVGYLLPEAIIAILFAVLAFFTGGGTAPALYARLAAFVLRVTNSLKSAGRAGVALLKVFNLLRRISNKIIDLIRALKAKISEVAESATEQITRITRKVSRHDVPCFDLPNGADPVEFDRQLAEQMATINAMTADDMAYAHQILDQARAEKARLQAMGEWSGGSFTDLLRDNSTQQRARATHRQLLQSQGFTPAQIRQQMNNLNATHYLDIIAGGDPSSVGIGGAAENQGIGRQWPRDSRSDGIGVAARDMRNNGMSNRNMDVTLRRCR